MQKEYEDFLDRIIEIRRLHSVSSLLGWDQETYMPTNGGQERAEQSALMSSLAHERMVCSEMGELLDSLKDSEELSWSESVNVRETRRNYERSKKLPTELVEEMSRTQSLSQQSWVKARKASDFSIFQPWLEKSIELQKQAAELFGYEGDIYNALIEGYEPGMTAEELEPMFNTLREHIVPLVSAIMESDRKPDHEAFSQKYSVEAQQSFAKSISSHLGFNFDSGRLDLSAHPFCCGMNSSDVRLTTRYDENDPFSGLYAVIHETGHGLYEQGFESQYSGTPMSSAISLGIHESQSLTWENLVCRSRAFSKFALPRFKDAFPEFTDTLDQTDLYHAVNKVSPSLIRVEADEVTYNLHVLLRFELERELINGRIEVSNLPELWNSKMEDYLGIVPPDDARGVLQDIHWSMGLMGYFPTYTLGYLYGAQFFEAVRRDLPNIDRQVGEGDFSPLRGWLRENIHQHGKRYQAKELVEKVTGKPPESGPFLTYLTDKYTEIYGL